jgi:peptidoglycan hydrolase-like protein with peptidoglycan-binding domain
LALLCAGAGGAWWLATATQTPSEAAARSQAPVASWITSAVERRVLAETVTGRGDVVAPIATPIDAPTPITDGVLTQPIPRQGTIAELGERVLEVSGRPVFVIAGTQPLYRALRPGSQGADVAQLQAALTSLGYAPETDGSFGPATGSAVAAFYADAGYEPVMTDDANSSTVADLHEALADAEAELAVAERSRSSAAAGPPASVRVAAEAAVNRAGRAVRTARARQHTMVATATERADAAVRARDRLVAAEAPQSDLDAAELEIIESAGALEDATLTAADALADAEESLLVAQVTLDGLAAPIDLSALDAQVASAIARRDRAARNLANAQLAAGPTVPLGEVVVVPQLPARISPSTLVVDTGSPLPRPLLTVTAGELLVRVSVGPQTITFVHTGMAVDLLDEATGTAFTGKVVDVGEGAVTRQDGSIGIDVDVRPDEPLPASMVGANLRVSIVAAATVTPALIVPLAAVSTRADGSTVVSVVRSPNDPQPNDIEVSAGPSAAGEVAVEPISAGSLRVGQLVVVGR